MKVKALLHSTILRPLVLFTHQILSWCTREDRCSTAHRRFLNMTLEETRLLGLLQTCVAWGTSMNEHGLRWKYIINFRIKNPLFIYNKKHSYSNIHYFIHCTYGQKIASCHVLQISNHGTVQSILNILKLII